MSYNIDTGVMTSWAPQLNAQARAIAASPDGKRIYVVGDFTQVDGQWRVRVAAFDTATGALVAGFRPSLAANGLAVAATNTAVYVGGDFTTAASVTGGAQQPRSHVAGFNAADGALLPFQADANASVTALAVVPDGPKVVIGGRFTALSGTSAYGLGWVSAATGAALSFPTNTVVRNSGVNSTISSLYADSSGIYGTGYVYTGGNMEGMFRADLATGQLIWIEDCKGDTYSAYPLDDAVYVASHQHNCASVGGFGQTQPVTYHYASAFTKAATRTNVFDGATNYPWSHVGRPAPSLLTWFPYFYSGTYTGQGQAGWSVAGNGDYVVYGGEFPGVANRPQQGLVRFVRPGFVPPPVNQRPVASFTGSVAALTVTVNGSNSKDPDGTIAAYAWNFGDGTTGTGVSASHTYAKAGTYQVTLTVTDNAGATGSVSGQMTVAAGPVNPLTGTATCAGALAALSGTAGAGHLVQIRDAAWNIVTKVNADGAGKWTAINVPGLCAAGATNNVILEEASAGKRVALLAITAASQGAGTFTAVVTARDAATGAISLSGLAGAKHLVLIRDATWNIKAQVYADAAGRWTATAVTGLLPVGKAGQIIAEEANAGKRVAIITVNVAK